MSANIAKVTRILLANYTKIAKIARITKVTRLKT